MRLGQSRTWRTELKLFLLTNAPQKRWGVGGLSKIEQPLTQIWNDQHAVSFLYNLLQQRGHTWKLWNLSLHPDLALILSGRMCFVLLLTMLVLKWKRLALSSIHPHRACKQSTHVKLEHSPLNDYPASVGVYVQITKEACVLSQTRLIQTAHTGVLSSISLFLSVNLTPRTLHLVSSSNLRGRVEKYKLRSLNRGGRSPCLQAQQMRSCTCTEGSHAANRTARWSGVRHDMEEEAASRQQGRRSDGNLGQPAVLSPLADRRSQERLSRQISRKRSGASKTKNKSLALSSVFVKRCDFYERRRRNSIPSWFFFPLMLNFHTTLWWAVTLVWVVTLWVAGNKSRAVAAVWR